MSPPNERVVLPEPPQARPVENDEIGPQSRTRQVENDEIGPQSRTTPVENEENLLEQDTTDIADGASSTHIDVHYSSISSASISDIVDVTPSLFTSFMVDQLQVDGYDVPHVLLSQRAVATIKEVGTLLRRAANDFDRNTHMNNSIAGINFTPETAKATFMQVALEIFKDGLSWGRIAVFFYFACKFGLLLMRQRAGDYFRQIIGWVAEFVSQQLADWISSRGGWSSIREYFGSTNVQMVCVFVAGILTSYFFCRR